MRSIRVTYRAIFEQPLGLGPLNPMALKLPGQFPVEIFGTGEKWQAREIATARRQVYERLSRFTNPEMGRQIVEQAFARRIQDWQIWGTVPADPETGRVAEERMLIPGVDICDCGNHTWGLYGPNDFTHISVSGPRTDTTDTAWCGAVVSVKKVVSTRANVEPTCPKCAEIYRERYAKK